MSETSRVDTQDREVEVMEDNNMDDRGVAIFKTDKPVREYFPGHAYREGQAEAIDAIENAYK